MEKINIAKILKDCPKGMELDCTMYDGISLHSVDDREDIKFPIRLVQEDGSTLKLTKYGQYISVDFAKCIIFPKGKTTWEGFQRPFTFKDGDVIYVRTTFKWIAIYKELEKGRNEIGKYASICLNSRFNSIYIFDNRPLCHNKNVNEIRLATEEEKQKLFDAIKAKGYKWNPETKTLETLITLKFKIGDKIRAKGTNSYTKILGITWDQTETYYETPLCKISVKDQDKFELVPNKFDITTLKPFDKVLVRQNIYEKWNMDFYGYYNKGIHHTTGPCIYKQCVPYEGNEHLLGTTNDCTEYYKTWE